MLKVAEPNWMPVRYVSEWGAGLVNRAAQLDLDSGELHEIEPVDVDLETISHEVVESPSGDLRFTVAYNNNKKPFLPPLALSEFRRNNARAVIEALRRKYGAYLSPWRSGNPIGGWQKAEFLVADQIIPFAVSNGGVVQVEGHPFSPDKRLNTALEPLEQSLLAYARTQLTVVQNQWTPHEALGRCIERLPEPSFARLRGILPDTIRIIRSGAKASESELLPIMRMALNAISVYVREQHDRFDPDFLVGVEAALLTLETRLGVPPDQSDWVCQLFSRQNRQLHLVRAPLEFGVFHLGDGVLPEPEHLLTVRPEWEHKDYGRMHFRVVESSGFSRQLHSKDMVCALLDAITEDCSFEPHL